MPFSVFKHSLGVSLVVHVIVVSMEDVAITTSTTHLMVARLLTKGFPYLFIPDDVKMVSMEFVAMTTRLTFVTTFTSLFSTYRFLS